MNFLERLLGRSAQTVEQPNTYNLPPLQPVQNTPKLNPIMLNQNGGLMPQAETNKYLIDEPTYEQPTISSGLTKQPETNGIMQDLAAGFRDNLYNPISVNNFRPDPNKTWANKIGEGIGTGLRVLNSPTGRGLITAGIVGASGGSPLQALAYGGSAGVKNQQLRAQDKIYRQALEDNGIDTSNISGYIDGDMYKNYSLGNYRYGMLRLGNKKLSSTDYNNAVKEFGRQHTAGEISDEQYKIYIDTLNQRFIDDGIERAINVGKIGQSNQTYNTRVNVPKRLNIQQQNANTYQKGVAGNLGLKSGMQPLNKKKTQLQIEQIQKINNILNNPNGNKTINVGGNSDPLGLFEN